MDYKSFDEMPAFISIPEAAQFLGIATPSLYNTKRQITTDTYNRKTEACAYRQSKEMN